MLLALPELHAIGRLSREGWVLFATDRQRTQVFAWYNLAGSLAAACGAFGAGLPVTALQCASFQTADAQRTVGGWFGVHRSPCSSCWCASVSRRRMFQSASRIRWQWSNRTNTAAALVTTIVRTLTSAASPAITGALLGASLLSVPFFLAGGLKLLHEQTLYQRFRARKPPEERY
jgi:hypothetical protein